VLVQDVQKAGETKKTPKEIIASFESMPEVKKRFTLKALRLKNPELAAKQDEEKRLEEKATIDKNIIRQRRKKAAKAARIERALARKARQAEQTLQKDRIQRKDPRIAARPTNEKPAEVKHISPAVKQAELAPTAVKEEKKGISAQLMKIEQMNQAKEPEKMKGISAALAVAEQQKLQPVQNRVISESRGKFSMHLDESDALTEKQKEKIAAVRKAIEKQGRFTLQEEGRAPLNADQKKEMIAANKIAAEKARTAFRLQRQYRQAS